jgi:hypothetical protein
MRIFEAGAFRASPSSTELTLTLFPKSLMMIRFFCPLCHHTLNVSEEKAGAAVTCPRCNEVSVVPGNGSAAVRAGRGGAVERAAPFSGSGQGARPWDRAGALASGQRLWRYLVALVTAAGVLSLLLAVLAPALRFSEESISTARWAATLVVPSCLVILFVLLHGQGTSCPACERWWARTEGETECLGREEFQKEGVPWVRAKRRTTYACKHCRHTWAATYTDEYRGAVRRRKAPPSIE